MEGYQFLDDKGTFRLKNAENYSGLYFPVASDVGLKSAVTPNLGGDSKIDQNTFLLEPVSAENLHNNRGTRNFWCHVINVGSWSVTGASAEEMAKRFTGMPDESEVEAGLMWQQVRRSSEKYRLAAEVTSYAPPDENVEVMYVKITNTGNKQVEVVPTAAVPIYGRSADNIRDHRHVTSLLHRIKTVEHGVEVTPTLSFDERGHQKNNKTYFVYGFTGDGEAPEDFYPVVEDYIGQGGNFECPQAVLKNRAGVPAGTTADGQEALGGLHFRRLSIEPGNCAHFTVIMGITDDTLRIPQIAGRFSTAACTVREYKQARAYWAKKVNVAYAGGDKNFDVWMQWVSFQPILRRIYGCSFLPHHDYGKGGRGWRDLWQDCLALLVMNPGGVKQMLLDNFGGVRMDGTNATIIGSGQGEFLADRNNITRVWMDHGVWPFMTTKLYIDQTGDIGILESRVPYFKDRQTARGTRTDEQWDDSCGFRQKTADGSIYEGTVLEHLLLEHLTACYEVGEHGNIRLRGADWNDAMDMAEERGESVAFTNAYAGNLEDFAELLTALAAKRGKGEAKTPILRELLPLIDDEHALYGSAETKRMFLGRYLDTCVHDVSGEAVEVSIEALAESLRKKAAWIKRQIQSNEWIEDGTGCGWFNGYYDNRGRRVEGCFDTGVRMMLTSQVFAVMAGTAEKEQIKQITKSADRYLYRKEMGGYRLNTDFGGLNTDLGRMFGFAYGEKENGAVFSHMAVMYANALYKRGFIKEGYKALDALYRQSVNFRESRIYPGIPEYFNGRGRGMYHYLTGAASWYMLTVVTQMYGVRGCLGNLWIEPKLLNGQFDEMNTAQLEIDFGGVHWQVCYQKETDRDGGAYQIAEVLLDGMPLGREVCSIKEGGNAAVIAKRRIDILARDALHRLHVILR